LIVGNLNSFIETGERAKNIEVVYQGLQVLGHLAVVSAHKGLSLTLHGLLEKISKIAIYGLAQKQTIIVDLCSTTFLRIIGAVFVSGHIDRRLHTKDALKNIATISNHINTFINAGLLPNDISTRFSLSKGYDEFYMTLALIMENYSKLTEDKDECGRERGEAIAREDIRWDRVLDAPMRSRFTDFSYRVREPERRDPPALWVHRVQLAVSYTGLRKSRVLDEKGVGNIFGQ
jgi:hypothetical protein